MTCCCRQGSAPKTIRVWGRAYPDSAPLQLGQLTYLDGQVIVMCKTQ